MAMKILDTVLISLFLAGCHPGKKINDDRFLKLNAVSNTITYDESRIIYASWDTTICIYDVEKQAIQFKEKVADICYAKPILKEGKIYFPFSNQKFVCKELSSGELLWEIDLAGRCSNFDFIDDTNIVASVKHYGLVGLNAEKGKLLFELKYNYEETHLPDLSPWLISFDSNHFYVSNWQGNTLSSFKKDGTVNWHFSHKASGYAGRSIVLDDKLFVGVNEYYKGGGMIVLDKLNGEILHQQACKYEERAIPITVDECMYFYSYDKCLNKFDLSGYEITKIKTFENDYDMGGHQIFLGLDKIYYTDASFYLNSYSIPDHVFTRIQPTSKSLIGVCTYQGINYFIH